MAQIVDEGQQLWLMPPAGRRPFNSSFVLLRAYFYSMVLAREGTIHIDEYANYLLKRREAIGCQAAYPEHPTTHFSLPISERVVERENLACLHETHIALDWRWLSRFHSRRRFSIPFW